MTDGRKRLVEVAFPVEQVSLDSVHEKNVRHGHISTLHVWPARRPLAACRAALIATLLPDPDDPDERRAIYRRMAGEVVETVEDEKVGGRTVARRRRSTRGGVLHWKREDGPDLDWFRGRIREAYGAGRRGCSTRSPPAARFRWRRCGSGARRRRPTSTRWRGSS